jgi:hypothetical protein
MLDKRFYKIETHPERMNALGKAYAAYGMLISSLLVNICDN